MRKLFGSLMLLGALAVPHFSLAVSSLDANSTGLYQTGAEAYPATTTDSSTSLPEFIGSYILSPIFGLVGLIFFVLMVYAGFLWMTARGNEKQVTNAKDILTQTVIGAIIIIAAYVITNTIISALTGDFSFGGNGSGIEYTLNDEGNCV